ncbi:unnamed protein product, partial [Mesorhabditis belari]|uniref:Uncharacterized protein n=1 Tax=Mesorhabditis belari TaxID=2138241 RepID=A0AAF3EXE7_9BILA
MEYCDRGSLKTLILNPTIISTIRSVISWSQQLFGALDYMYQTFNIIHRDIKPTNIFVTNDFTLKVGDFGLAKVAVETMSGTFIGSYRYMSPTRPDYDARASHLHDIYAMGLVVWELIERRAVWSEYEADGEFRYHFFLYSFFEVAWPNGTLLATDSTGEYILDDGTDYQRIRENLLPSLQDAVLRFDIWQCGQGWSHFNGSCYQPSYFQKHPFQQEATFDEAERVCRNLAPGANLISIHSKEEQGFVHELVVENNHDCWIGLRHLENKWIWNDGTKVDYTNWDAANGEPSNVNIEKWVYMRPNGGKWNNVKKDYKALIGCKKPVGKLSQIA